MDVYILPKHIWEKYDEKAITKYNGAGRRRLRPVHARRGEARPVLAMEANDNYWGGKPEIDEVVFRLFNNARRDGRGAEERRDRRRTRSPGEVVRRASSRPRGSSRSRASRAASPRSRSTAAGPRTSGSKGSATAIRRSRTSRFRKAIAHAIDQQTLDRQGLQSGSPGPATTISPSPNPEWIPEIPADEQFGFDLDKAKQILDARRLQGHERQRHPRVRGGKDINLIYYILSDSTTAAPNAEFVTGLAQGDRDRHDAQGRRTARS